MTAACVLWRAGPGKWSWLVVLLLLAFLPPAAHAQVPDTVPPDTAGVEADTIPQDTAGVDTVQVGIPPDGVPADTVPADSVVQDSAVPVPPFPRYPRLGREGWAFGRWEWDREDLLRYHSLSLLQLIERVPGIHAVRVGDFGQPAGLTTLGGTGPRVEVYLDGFELDPLGLTTADLQRIALGDLESVRVERHLDGIRVDLTPMRLPDARPLSAVEAATGVYDTKLLRALLMRGVGRRSTVLAAFDQASSRGVGFDQAFSYSAGRAAVSYALGAATALQAEYRTETVESGGNAVPVDATRRTFLLRGRSEVLPGLMVDAMVGSSSRRPEERDPLDVDLSSRQGAVRASYDLGRLWLEGGARLRTHAEMLGLPSNEFHARAGIVVLPWVIGEGAVQTGAIAGVSGTRARATLRIGPFAGFSAFGTVGFGDRPLALVRDTTIIVPPEDPEEGESEKRVEPRFSAVSASARGIRVGGEWSLGTGSIGAAAVALPSDVAAPFGFHTIDRGFPVAGVPEARGIEAYASVPVPFTREYLRLDGWYNWWSTAPRPYVPDQGGRLALLAHGLFYGGDLEPSLRVEGVFRGVAPTLTPDPAEPMSFSPNYALANLQLEIRILAVRAFFVFDNLTNNRAAVDIVGHPLPAPRFYYGLRWTFRN